MGAGVPEDLQGEGAVGVAARVDGGPWTGLLGHGAGCGAGDGLPGFPEGVRGVGLLAWFPGGGWGGLPDAPSEFQVIVHSLGSLDVFLDLPGPPVPGLGAGPSGLPVLGAQGVGGEDLGEGVPPGVQVGLHGGGPGQVQRLLPVPGLPAVVRGQPFQEGEESGGQVDPGGEGVQQLLGGGVSHLSVLVRGDGEEEGPGQQLS